jgi:hypothetical protein
MRQDDRPADPRMPRATYKDPRAGTAAPSGVAGALILVIAYAFAGPTGVAIAVAALVLVVVAWLAVRHTRS